MYDQTLGKRNYQLMLIIIAFLHYSPPPHLFILLCALVLTFGRLNHCLTTHLDNPSHLPSIAISVILPSLRSLVKHRMDLKNTEYPIYTLGIVIT